jgi:hypothetical protein
MHAENFQTFSFGAWRSLWSGILHRGVLQGHKISKDWTEGSDCKAQVHLQASQAKRATFSAGVT